MMFLQIANDTLNVANTTMESSFFEFSWSKIEEYVIYALIATQIVQTYLIGKNIYKLKNIFKFPIKVKAGYIERDLLNNNSATLDDVVFDDDNDMSLADQIVDKDIVKLTIIRVEGYNSIGKKIEKSINNYLLNNYGANVNFSIIKDMIDREIDSKDEEINQSIPTPLYLGLAATMFGIIFGLASMPNIEGDNFIVAINVLINGVKWAMVASVSGLLLTTILSSFFYKRAKTEILNKKNEQLSHLQAELLPELIKAEDTGVSGLKASLDHFAREATTIVDSVKIASINTGANIKAQLDVLEKVENLNINRVSKVSLALFDRLDVNMKAFDKFSKNVSIIENISTNLKDFASRTGSIDTVANQINSSLEESRKLSRFLTEHFEKIESSGNQALNAVTYSDSHFREAIDKLTEEIDERISKINSNTSDHESQLEEVYNKIGEKLNTITSEHLKEFQLAYSDAVPKFNNLNHLEVLEPIKESLDQNFQQSKNGSDNLNGKVHEIKNYLEKESVVVENIKNLENVIRELSIVLTGKDSLVAKSETKWTKFLKKTEFSLRTIGWLVITSFGVYAFLTHFKIAM